jgi:hypothetical protein
MLQVIVKKLKWEEDADLDDPEDDDNAEFEKMRKVSPVSVYPQEPHPNGLCIQGTPYLHGLYLDY